MNKKDYINFNELLKGNDDEKLLFFGFIGNLNISEDSLIYNEQSNHTAVMLLRIEHLYKVRIGCYACQFTEFKKILRSKDLLKTVTRYFKIYHKKHGNRILWEAEVTALSKHHVRYYRSLEILFNKLVIDDLESIGELV